MPSLGEGSFEENVSELAAMCNQQDATLLRTTEMMAQPKSSAVGDERKQPYGTSGVVRQARRIAECPVEGEIHVDSRPLAIPVSGFDRPNPKNA